MTTAEVFELAHKLVFELPCVSAPPGYLWSPPSAWSMSYTGDVCRWLYRYDQRVAVGRRIVVPIEAMLEHETDPDALRVLATTLQNDACFIVVMGRLGVKVRA